jgi:hypothetical protein
MLGALGTLAGASGVYRAALQEVVGLVQRLSDDYGPAAGLLTSISVAIGPSSPHHPALGTPAHIEATALEILRDLKQPLR